MPPYRRRMRRRANRQAEREIQPLQQEANREIGNIRRDLRTETTANRRAANMAASAIGDTSLAGLRGRYRKQVGREMALRAADLRRSVPFMNSAVRSTALESIADVRSGVPSVRSVARENLREMLAARGESQRIAEAERQEGQAKAQAEIRLAVRQAQNMLKQDPPKDLVSKEAVKLGRPVTESDWSVFLERLEGKEGVGMTAAEKAVKRIRARMLRQAQERAASTFGPSWLPGYGPERPGR